VEILSDEPKRLSNIARHGLEFAGLTVGFFETAIIMAAKDNRLKAIGTLDDGTIVVIVARLGREAVSVISMRPANRSERGLTA